jgi:hypothetical protein
MFRSPLRSCRLERFVLIRNFDQSDKGRDQKALKALTNCWGNEVWRFLDLKRGKAKSAALSRLPIFVAEQARVNETRQKARERTLAAKAAGKLKGFSSGPTS